MKKITSFILILNLIYANCFASTIKDKISLVEPYFIALDYTPWIMEEVNFIAIDMSTDAFKDFSEKDKQAMLEHLRKYNQNVINESFDSLKENGLLQKTNKVYFVPGIILGIQKVEIKNDNEVVVEAYWFAGTKADRILRNTMVFEDNEWKSKKVESIGII